MHLWYERYSGSRSSGGVTSRAFSVAEGLDAAVLIEDIPVAEEIDFDVSGIS